jgi:hypothetical protein
MIEQQHIRPIRSVGAANVPAIGKSRAAAISAWS